MDIHSQILGDEIRNPEISANYSSAFSQWVKPSQDAEMFVLQRWLEWYRRGLLAGTLTVEQLQVNLTNHMTREAGALMWALTRDHRLSQSVGSRSGMRFWGLADNAFIAAGGEITYADVIREQRELSATSPHSLSGCTE